MISAAIERCAGIDVGKKFWAVCLILTCQVLSTGQSLPGKASACF
jgi:hypothetical protein